MLTRSYLIDITLVALASFTLLCVFGQTYWQTAHESADRFTFAVEIEQADGRTKTYRVHETRQTAGELRADVVQRMSGPSTPDIAWMQWFQETAERYAATCSAPAKATPDPSSDAASVFHTVSTGSTSSVVDSDETQHLSRWRDFWTQRQSHATAWLANHEQRDQARRAALSASIRITPVRSSIPPASVCAKALLITTLVVLFGMAWRLVSPPRSCRLHRVVPAMTSIDAAESDKMAAMCFRESWVRVRQPVSAVLRGVAGWSIVLASLAACGSVMIHSLVS